MINYKESEIGLIPEDWDAVRLGDYLEEKKIKNSENKKLPVYSVSNIYGFILSDTFFDKRVYSKNLNTYKLVKKDDFAYNPYRINVGSIGLFNNNEIGLVSSAYVVFMISKRDSLSEEFLFLLLKSDRFINEIKRISMSRGSVRRTLSFKDLIQIKIPVPPFPEQQTIAKVLSKIQQAIEQQDKIIEVTKNLKKSLMKKLFTEGLGHTEFKETEIGQIPKTWEAVRLENVVELRRGVSWRKEEANKSGKGLPVVAIPNIGFGTLDFEFQHFLTKKVSNKKLLQIDDILFVGSSGSIHNIGRNVLVRNLPLDKISFASFLGLMRVNKNEVSSEFLYYLINSKWIDFKKFTKRAADGKYNFQLRDFQSNVVIPLPPFPEQQQIAHILSTIDKKIETEEKRKATLKELFKTMLHKLMTCEIRLKDIEI